MLIKRIKSRVKTGVTALQRRGPGFAAYVVLGHTLPKASFGLVYGKSRQPLRRLMRQGVLRLNGTALSVPAMIERAREATARAKNDPLTFTSWRDWPVTETTRQAVENARAENPDAEIVLGQIDGDGRVLPNYGPLPGLVAVDKSEFLERSRYPLEIVLIGDSVLIRKSMRGDTVNFAREWHNLAVLGGKASVPALYRVDEEQTVLYKNLISAQTLRDLLVQAGAHILSVETEHDPQLRQLSAEKRIQAVWDRGRAVFDAVPQLTEEFFTELEKQIDAIHACGIAGLSLTYGNVMVDGDGKPWLIDFEKSTAFPSTSSLAFANARDQDREKYNRIYGRQLLTERGARQLLAETSARYPGWYAPIDFGNGLAVGSIWATEAGTGRWESLNKALLAPLMQDKRVLDLGSNNGFMPLMMLRSGARQVVGMEMFESFAQAAKTVHRLFEWRDMRNYDFQLHQADMREMLTAEWGNFDVVTSFCALYYLEEEDMAAVTRKAAELAPMFILQSNDNTRSEAADNKAEKSSTEFMKRLLEENGFPHVEVHAPANFSRPILIGRKTA